MQIKILTHNVYWFQGHPFTGDRPEQEHPIIFQRLCALYAQTGADLLCLQEIQSENVADKAFHATGMHGIYSPGNLYAHYGGMIAARSGYPLENRTVQAPSLRERSSLAATVSGFGATLEIANLHLTSGRQSGQGKAGLARAGEIGEFLSTYGNQTDVLVGDFNENRDGGTVSRLLEENGFVDTAVVSGQEATSASVKSHARTDMIWVHQRIQKYLTGYGVLHEEFAVDDLPDKTFLSDHRPVWITLAF